MVFVPTVLLLSLLQKTPLNGAVFHASCAVACACAAVFLRAAQFERTLKGAGGLRLRASPPATGGGVAFAFASAGAFFITPPFLAAFPYLLTCYLGLPSHAGGNIPVMICSLLLGLSVSFGGAPVLLSAFACLWLLMCRGAVFHRATPSTWWWCVVVHVSACVLSCLFASPSWKGTDCIIPAFLGVLHVVSNGEVVMALVNTKRQIRCASHVALCLTFVVFPAYQIANDTKTLVGGIFTLCLASGSLWYYDFDSEWLRRARPSHLAPSQFGVALGVYALIAYLLGVWLLP
jgi:hypothetical protein